MSNYHKELILHLAKHTGLDENIINEAFNTFRTSQGENSSQKQTNKDFKPIAKKDLPPKKNVTTNNNTFQKSNASSSSDEDNKPTIKSTSTVKSTSSVKTSLTKKTQAKEEPHVCSRIKKGQVEPCGKPAKRSYEVNGKLEYFCGAEKSGCYAMILKSNAEETLKKNIESNKKTVSKSNTKDIAQKNNTNKPTTNVGRKNAADEKTNSLLSKANSLVKELKTSNITTDKHGTIHYYTEKRIVIDTSTQEAYGVLDENNEDIKPLTDDDIRFLECNKVRIRQSEKDEKNKSVGKNNNENYSIDEEADSKEMSSSDESSSIAETESTETEEDSEEDSS